MTNLNGWFLPKKTDKINIISNINIQNIKNCILIAQNCLKIKENIVFIIKLNTAKINPIKTLFLAPKDENKWLIATVLTKISAIAIKKYGIICQDKDNIIPCSTLYWITAIQIKDKIAIKSPKFICEITV